MGRWGGEAELQFCTVDLIYRYILHTLLDNRINLHLISKFSMSVIEGNLNLYICPPNAGFFTTFLMRDYNMLYIHVFLQETCL